MKKQAHAYVGNCVLEVSFNPHPEKLHVFEDTNSTSDLSPVFHSQLLKKQTSSPWLETVTPLQ